MVYILFTYHESIRTGIHSNWDWSNIGHCRLQVFFTTTADTNTARHHGTTPTLSVATWGLLYRHIYYVKSSKMTMPWLFNSHFLGMDKSSQCQYHHWQQCTGRPCTCFPLCTHNFRRELWEYHYKFVFMHHVVQCLGQPEQSMIFCSLSSTNCP